jgi:hypothetical protein
MRKTLYCELYLLIRSHFAMLIFLVRILDMNYNDFKNLKFNHVARVADKLVVESIWGEFKVLNFSLIIFYAPSAISFENKFMTTEHAERRRGIKTIIPFAFVIHYSKSLC